MEIKVRESGIVETPRASIHQHGSNEDVYIPCDCQLTPSSKLVKGCLSIDENGTVNFYGWETPLTVGRPFHGTITITIP